MNWLQISGILRHILTFGGGLLVASGWISEGLMLDIVGAAITIGGVIWSMVNKTSTNMVASAAALPEVQSIKLEQSAPIEMAAPANVSK